MFNLQEYRNGKISPKLRYFFEYLDTTLSEKMTFDNEYFELLNEHDFLDALKDYIEKASPARQTAQDYIRDVRNFFEMLRVDYGIRNSVFYDNEIYTKFEKMKNTIISQLREQENKECISDDEFEKLSVEMAEFLNMPNLENDILQDIEDNYLGTRKNSKYYSRFVSIIPIQLAMKYALSNRAMVNIKMNDLDLKNRILYVNDFQLPLSRTIVELLELYCRLRTLIVELSHSDLEFLFLKVDGSSYISKKNVPDYATFFFFMRESIDTYACKRLSYKRIVEVVDKGADINVLAQLVNVKPETIRSLCNIDNDSAKLTVIEILSEPQNEIKKKEIIPKGTMKCVYCGKIKDADADNWLLIQKVDSEHKYLACRECKGKDGKYRY